MALTPRITLTADCPKCGTWLDWPLLPRNAIHPPGMLTLWCLCHSMSVRLTPSVGGGYSVSFTLPAKPAEAAP